MKKAIRNTMALFGLACIFIMVGATANHYIKKSWSSDSRIGLARVNVDWLYAESGQEFKVICKGQLNYMIDIRKNKKGKYEALCPNHSEYVQWVIPTYKTVPLSGAAASSIERLVGTDGLSN